MGIYLNHLPCNHIVYKYIQFSNFQWMFLAQQTCTCTGTSKPIPAPRLRCFPVNFAHSLVYIICQKWWYIYTVGHKFFVICPTVIPSYFSSLQQHFYRECFLALWHNTKLLLFMKFLNVWHSVIYQLWQKATRLIHWMFLKVTIFKVK